MGLAALSNQKNGLWDARKRAHPAAARHIPVRARWVSASGFYTRARTDCQLISGCVLSKGVILPSWASHETSTTRPSDLVTIPTSPALRHGVK